MAKILSIEDDGDLQHMIGQALYREGYEMHYAWNGEEGYQKLVSTRPDLVLLDLMLPIMNGVELLKKLREDKATREIPVMILSAYGDEANMLGHSVRALGAADYLRKPVSMPELVSRVKLVLSRQVPDLQPTSELRKGAIRVDMRFRTVWIEDKLVATLTFTRFALLKCLMQSRGPVSPGRLLRALGYGPTQLNALEKSLQRLREDLGPGQARRLQTTPKGYEMVG